MYSLVASCDVVTTFVKVDEIQGVTLFLAPKLHTLLFKKGEN